VRGRKKANQRKTLGKQESPAGEARSYWEGGGRTILGICLVVYFGGGDPSQIKKKRERKKRKKILIGKLLKRLANQNWVCVF